MTAIITSDVPSETADILSSATMVVLHKKIAATMEELKRRQGAAYIQFQWPIGMGISTVKVACNCALLQIKYAMGPNLAYASLNNVNAYGEIEWECIEAKIKSNLYFHSLLPLFELVYKRRPWESWYYDEDDNFVMGTRQKK
jgi:hypothetical protein